MSSRWTAGMSSAAAIVSATLIVAFGDPASAAVPMVTNNSGFNFVIVQASDPSLPQVLYAQGSPQGSNFINVSPCYNDEPASLVLAGPLGRVDLLGNCDGTAWTVENLIDRPGRSITIAIDMQNDVTISDRPPAPHQRTQPTR
jgi:hypothetical protein